MFLCQHWSLHSMIITAAITMVTSCHGIIAPVELHDLHHFGRSSALDLPKDSTCMELGKFSQLQNLVQIWQERPLPIACGRQRSFREAENALVAEALITHVLAKNASIRNETAVSNAHVVIDFEDLLVGT